MTAQEDRIAINRAIKPILSEMDRITMAKDLQKISSCNVYTDHLFTCVHVLALRAFIQEALLHLVEMPWAGQSSDHRVPACFL